MSEGYPSLLRSEEMSLVQLFVPIEIAHDAVAELGEQGNVQFIDLNSHVNPFQRSFVGEIRRIEEMERRVRFFSIQIINEQDTVPIRPLPESTPLITVGPRVAQTIDELDFTLAGYEQRLIQMNSSYELLSERKKELIEVQNVLRETAIFFNKVQSHEIDIRSSFDDSATTPLLQVDDYEAGFPSSGGVPFDIDFIAGTIERSRYPVFERVLWRVLRGNLFMNHADILEPFVDPINGDSVRKNVFIAITHGEGLLAKIRKVAESMGASIYSIDANADKRSDSLREVTRRLEDLQVVLHGTNVTRRLEFINIGEHLRTWQDILKKEKLIYETLNLFNYNVCRKTLIAEGWAPRRDIPAIQIALRFATERSGTSISPVLHELETHKKPPTFYRTNSFTEGFQTLMGNYGVPAYREINPGLFAIITFPFLFAVMFGDIGHGAIIFLAALYMILKEKELAKSDLDEIISQFFFGRYLILLMGLFSMYTGLLYNDLFSRSLHLWNSAWSFSKDNETITAILNENYRYPFGLDPSWHGASNALVFTNSYKMKTSIILGVTHMTFALCLQVPNHLKFKRYSDIYTNFIPQMIFLQSIFGYLVWCILYKWSIDWAKVTTQPPSLLNMLISMFLNPGTVDPKVQLYRRQGTVQVALLLMAGVCVPWLLLAKPYLVWRERKIIRDQGYTLIYPSERDASDMALLGLDINANTDGEDSIGQATQGVGEDGEHEHHDFFDVMIYQIIHTIEFCLNCISHTASYLRLWALSLAHAQLSEVLWSKTIGGYLNPTSVFDWVMLLSKGSIWVFLTICGLCIIEGLSAFLHALRLHWVEANSKHFEGGGHAFTPVSFSKQAANE